MYKNNVFWASNILFDANFSPNNNNNNWRIFILIHSHHITIITYTNILNIFTLKNKCGYERPYGLMVYR